MENNLRILPVSTVDDQDTLAHQLISIDYQCFRNLEIEDEGSAKQWISVNDSCYTHIIYNKDNPVGYIDFVSINKKGVDKLLEGNLRDGDLPDYSDQSSLSPITLYLAVIAILPEYRGKGFSGKLWNRSREFFISQGLIIESVYGTVWTDEGCDFLNHFDIEIKGNDYADHHIVEVKVEDGQLPLYKNKF